jgi:hypothetical protein
MWRGLNVICHGRRTERLGVGFILDLKYTGGANGVCPQA